MPQVIVFITRLWNNNNNNKISLAFNSTQSTTSPADFNGRLRAGVELCSTNTQSPAKTVPPPYHTGSSCATLPTNGFFTPKATSAAPPGLSPGAGCSLRVGTSRMKPRAGNKAFASTACVQRAGCVW